MMSYELLQIDATKSHNYYRFIKKWFSKDADSYSKLIGRFYTNEFIYIDLIRTMLNHIIKDYVKLRIIDPFCGDGRLVVQFLNDFLKSEKSNKTQEVAVSIWDIDESTTESARENIIRIAKEHSEISITVDVHVGDTFIDSITHDGGYDICITNPPWCILKPNINSAKHLPVEEVNDYKIAIEEYSRVMEQIYCYSMPAKRFGRWGINLSRCGVECAVHLLDSDGICGIVLPASFFSDQVTAPLRKWLIEKHDVKAFAYYPAELKLFGTVDQSSATVVLSKREQSTHEFTSTVYDKNKNGETVILDGECLSFMKVTQYAIPFGYDENLISIARRLLGYKTLADYSELKIGRELDETRIDQKLSDVGTLRFIKGFMVGRYTCMEEPIRYLDESKVKDVPASIRYERIAWRDVSRSSQKRRMQATILPAGTITGNSLGVIYIPDAPHEMICFILAVINSLIFEYQARRHLVTNHVASGVIKSIPIPDMKTEFIQRITLLVDSIMDGHENTVDELECLIGISYGLTCDEFLRIAKSFSHTEEELARLSGVAFKVWQGEEIL